ncbi:MAG TPA: NUDIX domain-containing protein [Actinomycetota bacterium]|nr:NUDIX domain-containing protein [Actinomycetota bacterium]
MGVEEPRVAATVIAAREGAMGVEVLVLERSPTSRFLPGYVVFPGGAVDPEDHEHARRWFGTAEEAPRACAVRELLEEAGLALTAGGLLAGGLESVDAEPPRVEQLRQISHWVAPEDVPVRFDARFFALEAPEDVEPRPDGGETARAWWSSPAVLMEEWAAQRCRLYWPTMKIMEALARCVSVDGVLATRIQQEEPVEEDEERMPRSTFYQDDE